MSLPILPSVDSIRTFMVIPGWPGCLFVSCRESGVVSRGYYVYKTVRLYSGVALLRLEGLRSASRVYCRPGSQLWATSIRTAHCKFWRGLAAEPFHRSSRSLPSHTAPQPADAKPSCRPPKLITSRCGNLNRFTGGPWARHGGLGAAAGRIPTPTALSPSTQHHAKAHAAPE